MAYESHDETAREKMENSSRGISDEDIEELLNNIASEIGDLNDDIEG